MVRLGNRNLKLFPHNLCAYDAVCRLLEKEGKAAVIHPTGTGKSFIAFQLVLDNPYANVLWLSPSEYIFQTQVGNLKSGLFGVEGMGGNLSTLEKGKDKKRGTERVPVLYQQP